MELTAIFESWHIGDGNYPPLEHEQLVRLSFELTATRLEAVSESEESRLVSGGNAEYAGVGRVLRRYETEGYSLAVIEAGRFRFYVHGSRAAALKPAMWVHFEGTLLFDHYLWVEFLGRYKDPPDLFYTLRVTRIRRVSIPERFVQRGSRRVSYPTTVSPEDFGAVEELTTMEGQEFMQEFYIIDFDGTDLQANDVAQTFQ